MKSKNISIDYTKRNDLKINLNSLLEKEIYLINTIENETLKYWDIRQLIKDEYKFINGHSVFKALENQINLIEIHKNSLLTIRKEIKQLKIIMRSDLINSQALKDIQRLKKENDSFFKKNYWNEVFNFFKDLK
jgi:hypothetical protein